MQIPFLKYPYMMYAISIVFPMVLFIEMSFTSSVTNLGYLNSTRLFEDSVYTDVDESAYFKGGEDSLKAFIRRNLQPSKVAKELSVKGMAFVKFIIEKDGSVSEVTPIAPRERRLGYGLEEEYMRVIGKSSGNWIAAKKNGVVVRSYYLYPFFIDLENDFQSSPKKRSRKRRK